MDQDRARELLTAERERVEGLVAGLAEDRASDREAADDRVYWSDAAQPITAENHDDDATDELGRRLDAIGRAEERLKAGTYGRSVQSGDPIPDERLEADPAAELTVEEASAAER